MIWKRLEELWFKTSVPANFDANETINLLSGTKAFINFNSINQYSRST